MNYDLLEKNINDSGISKIELANSLGLTRQGLYKKLNGKSEFKASEIKKISSLLNLNDDDFNQIFFDDYVGVNANN